MSTETYDNQALSLALQDLDGEVSSILQKLKNCPQDSIVAELHTQISAEELVKARLSLFDEAVSLYDEQLSNNGLAGKASIALVDRRGDKRLENLSKDIVKLVNYNARVKPEFPREVMSSKSVYVEIDSSSGGPLGNSAPTSVDRPKTSDGKVYDDQQMIGFLHGLAGKTNLNITRLWEYVYNLEKIIQTSQTPSNSENGSDPNSQKNSDSSHTTSDSSGLSDSIPNAQKSDVNKSLDHPKEKPKKKNKKKPKSKPAKETNTEEKSYTQLMDSSDDESESSENETESSENESEKESSPAESDTESEDDSRKHSKTPSSGKWDGTAGKNGTKRTNKGKTDKKKNDKLSGIDQEAVVALYVQNIRKTPDMSLGRVASMVRNHLKEKGVRCLYAQVIRNRYMEDVVGCKIIVPLRQRDKAIGIKIWPDKVKCREWAGSWDSSGDSIARHFGELEENIDQLRGSDRGFSAGPRRYYGRYGRRRGQWYD